MNLPGENSSLETEGLFTEQEVRELAIMPFKQFVQMHELKGETEEAERSRQVIKLIEEEELDRYEIKRWAQRGARKMIRDPAIGDWISYVLNGDTEAKKRYQEAEKKADAVVQKIEDSYPNSESKWA